MALPVSGSTHLIPAYYSFIDPERMKGCIHCTDSRIRTRSPISPQTDNTSSITECQLCRPIPEMTSSSPVVPDSVCVHEASTAEPVFTPAAAADTDLKVCMDDADASSYLGFVVVRFNFLAFTHATVC